MRGRVGDISGSGLALRTDHSRALVNTAQRLTEICRTTDEGNGEVPLVDMVAVVGGSQHLRLVDVVDAKGLQNLCLNEVTDASLCHDRNGDSINNAVNQIGI